MNKKNVFGILTLTVLLGAGFWLWQNKYNVYDWFVLRDYQPSQQIVALADNSSMNDYGRRLFYVNDPQVASREEFAAVCDNNKEQTIVLGCFTGRNIYVFDVQDERLSGVEEVTSAHEMLHAAFERLSAAEKNRVSDLINQAYQRINNPRISGLVENYRKADATVVPNELHSILGTEVANLGPELEQYYSQYFSDRSKVVTLSQNYEKKFADLKNQVEKYDADLALRRAEIERYEKELTQKSSELANLKKEMDQYLRQNQTESYNALVPVYNNEVGAYNAKFADYKSLLAQYNDMVEKRNSLATEQQGLVESLDSRLKSISQ